MTKNTFKFISVLNKNVRAKAYRSLLKECNVTSKRQFMQGTVDGSLEVAQQYMPETKDKASRIKAADELWKSSIRYGINQILSSKELKITSFKKLNLESGLLAVLKTAKSYGRNFTWFELVTDISYDKVWQAFKSWSESVGVQNKDGSYSFHAYATNYYNAYRSYLNRIGAIKQTSHGHWCITKFGKLMASELLEYYRKNNH